MFRQTGILDIMPKCRLRCGRTADIAHADKQYTGFYFIIHCVEKAMLTILFANFTAFHFLMNQPVATWFWKTKCVQRRLIEITAFRQAITMLEIRLGAKAGTSTK
jgi:hypothetical protein